MRPRAAFLPAAGGLGDTGGWRGGVLAWGQPGKSQGITPWVRSVPDPGGLCASWEKQPREQRGCSDPSTAAEPPWEGPLGPWTCSWPAQGMAGLMLGQARGVPCVVSPPFTIPLTPRDRVPPAGHEEGSTEPPRAAWGAASRGLLRGDGVRVTQPFSSRVFTPGEPCNVGGAGSRPCPVGAVLQGASCSTLQAPLARPRSPRVLAVAWARGVIGAGTFAPGPGPGFILSADVCAKQAEHAVPAARSGSGSCGARKRILTAPVSA